MTAAVSFKNDCVCSQHADRTRIDVNDVNGVNGVNVTIDHLLMALGGNGEFNRIGTQSTIHQPECFANNYERIEAIKNQALNARQPVSKVFAALSPLYRGETSQGKVAFTFEATELDSAALEAKIEKGVLEESEKFFKAKGNARCPYGTCVHVTKTVFKTLGEGAKTIVNIAVLFSQKAWIPTYSASDVVFGIKINVREGEGVKPVIYSPFIIRGKEPGKNKGATAGGINAAGRDKDGKEIENSSIYTILHEMMEEMSLAFDINPTEFERLQTDYECTEYKTSISLVVNDSILKAPCVLTRGHTIRTDAHNITEGGETMDNSCQTRVHKTTGWACSVDLTTQEFSSIVIADKTNPDIKIKAGDDAKAVFLLETGDLIEKSVSEDTALNLGEKFAKDNEFGILHHGKVVGNCFSILHRVFYGEPTQEDKISSLTAEVKQLRGAAQPASFFSRRNLLALGGAVAVVAFAVFKGFIRFGR
jgi:hypothetical protein